MEFFFGHRVAARSRAAHRASGPPGLGAWGVLDVGRPGTWTWLACCVEGCPKGPALAMTWIDSVSRLSVNSERDRFDPRYCSRLRLVVVVVVDAAAAAHLLSTGGDRRGFVGNGGLGVLRIIRSKISLGLRGSRGPSRLCRLVRRLDLGSSVRCLAPARAVALERQGLALFLLHSLSLPLSPDARKLTETPPPGRSGPRRAHRASRTWCRSRGERQRSPTRTAWGSRGTP